MTPHAIAGALLRALILEVRDLPAFPSQDHTAHNLAALVIVAESEAPSAIAAAARMASTSADAWAGAARGSAEWAPLASIWHRAALVLEQLAGRGAEPAPPRLPSRRARATGGARAPSGGRREPRGGGTPVPGVGGGGH